MTKTSASTAQLGGSDIAFLRSRSHPDFESGSDSVRLVDLFCGCGGLTLGVAEACRALGRGLDVRLAVELDRSVRDVYDANFRSALTTARADVHDRFSRRPGRALAFVERATAKEVGRIDLLVGGPPCQGHSDLNNHTRRVDPKNELYMVMVRAAEVLEPAHVIIENVQGIRRDHSGVLSRAIDRLVHLGYSVDEALVRMTDIGVPQRRVRHVLVASLAGTPSLSRVLQRSAVRRVRDLRWAIGDLAARVGTTREDTPSRLSRANTVRAEYLLRSGTFDLPNHRRPACHRDNPTHRYTAMYGRLRWEEPAYTITTGFGSPGQGRYLHPEEPRTLTPHEAARVQFFPDWFPFSAAPTRSILAHCIGNAVPPKLSYVVALDRLGVGLDQTAAVAAAT